MNDSQVKKRITFVYKCDKPEFLFNLAEIIFIVINSNIETSIAQLSGESSSKPVGIQSLTLIMDVDSPIWVGDYLTFLL